MERQKDLGRAQLQARLRVVDCQAKGFLVLGRFHQEGYEDRSACCRPIVVVRSANKTLVRGANNDYPSGARGRAAAQQAVAFFATVGRLGRQVKFEPRSTD